ncbi:MAG: helix-turn-helix transcriptional regulator [Armatimonadetes bacterium]|nr:LuxR family transcriptional regulator [Armatimonadota bacterium]NOG92457.1 helix-turn-helix transcriptional regulator [Armatimonadota bacterium]
MRNGNKNKGELERDSRISLSRRETQVLALIARGLSSKQAADDLCISKSTVDYHLENTYRKLGVSNRIQAIRKASEAGILPFVPSFSPLEIEL